MAKETLFKTITIPIVVPKGEYCTNYPTSDMICSYHDKGTCILLSGTRLEKRGLNSLKHKTCLIAER